MVTVNHSGGSVVGSIDLTIAPEMSGTSEVAVTVTDSLGASVTKIFMVTVNAVNDAPFLVTPIPDVSVNASYELKVPISKTLGVIFDDIDDETLAFDIMVAGGGELPFWVAMTGDTLVCTPMIADTGCVSIVVEVSDAAGETVADTFIICVNGYPVSISELGAGLFEVTMYPNPTRGLVNLSFKKSEINDVELSVVDITGRLVLQKQYSVNEQITFDMTGKVSGMYFVNINVDGKQVVKKLVVNR